jgi:hypothetical protein
MAAAKSGSGSSSTASDNYHVLELIGEGSFGTYCVTVFVAVTSASAAATATRLMLHVICLGQMPLHRQSI